MAADLKIDTPLSFAQRKEKLIREGAAYRSAMRRSRQVINDNLQTNVLARSVVGHLTGSAWSAVGNLMKVKSANLQTLLPILASGVSFALKARLLRPLLRTTVIAGGVGAGMYFLFRKRKAKQNTRLYQVR